MSIGIIGGADGPTSVFVASSVNWAWVIGSAALIAAGIVAVLVIRRRKKEGR